MFLQCPHLRITLSTSSWKSDLQQNVEITKVLRTLQTHFCRYLKRYSGNFDQLLRTLQFQRGRKIILDNTDS